MENKLRISKVWIEQKADNSPDDSYIGKYTDEAADWNICRHCGEYIANLSEDHPVIERGREYRYFKPEAGGEEAGSEEYQKYGKQDYKRAEDLNNGHWYFLGIIAKAEVVSPNNVVQIIRSGGLWGIESDSDASYIESVKKDELAELKEELAAFGLGERAIEYAMKKVEEKD